MDRRPTFPSKHRRAPPRAELAVRSSPGTELAVRSSSGTELAVCSAPGAELVACPSHGAPVIHRDHFTETVHRHQYSVGQVALTLQFVVTGNASLQSAARLMRILQLVFEDTIETPHWTTGRWWLLRLGYYMLCRPKVRGDDWVWMTDHSTQAGKERCLLILGIRLGSLPPVGQCLRLEDMEVIALIPVEKSDKQVVYQQLCAVAEKTGVPRAILHDNGGDLGGGVALFEETHPSTDGIYDMIHKAACLLKARLEKDPTWKAFSTQAAQTKFQTQQTELAFLVPPSQRRKARFMNLGDLIRWASETLAIVRELPPVVLKHVTRERLEEKLGWLRDYEEPLRAWSQMQQVIDIVNDFVRGHGHYPGSVADLRRQLKPLSLTGPAQALRTELVAFVRHESRKAKKGERLPGSTEVLESTFGKQKEIQGHQSKGGFTGLLLALPALLGTITADTVRAALKFAKTADVIQWIRDNLGQSHQSKRRLAYDAVRKAGAEPVPSLGDDRTGATESHGAPEQKKGEGRERVLGHGRERTESGGKTDGDP
jgi:hypothetical protein